MPPDSQTSSSIPVPAPPIPEASAVSAVSAVLPSRRRSPILFVYSLQEILLPLLLCLGGFMMLFVLGDTFNVLSDFLAAEADAALMLRYFALMQPVHLQHILPMSILLACSFAVTRLNSRHELTAVRASGISMAQFFFPAWLLAALLAGCLLLLSEWLAPQCMQKADLMLAALENPQVEDATPQVTRLAFRNAEGNRDWYFQKFARRGDQHGVLIKQFRPDRSIEWELRARKARHSNGRWLFDDAIINHYDAVGALPQGPPQRHQQYEVHDFNESPRNILNSLRPVEELSVVAMWQIVQTHERLPQSTRNVFFTTIWYRIFHPLSCLLAAFLGVGLNLNNQRSGAMKGFAIALAVMIAYYLAAQVFVLLGKNGVLPPLLAGSLPVLLFNAWGIWELQRRR